MKKVAIIVPHLGPQATLRGWANELAQDFQERFGKSNAKVALHDRDAFRFFGGSTQGALIYVTSHSETMEGRHSQDANRIASENPGLHVIIISSAEDTPDESPRVQRGKPTVIARSRVRDAGDLLRLIQ